MQLPNLGTTDFPFRVDSFVWVMFTTPHKQFFTASESAGCVQRDNGALWSEHQHLAGTGPYQPAVALV